MAPPEIDEIDAGQPVVGGDLLGAEMLLHRQRIIGAALHRRVIGDDDRKPPADAADPGNEAGGRHLLGAIAVARRELADLEKGGAGVEQTLHPLAGEELAACDMPRARRLGPAERHLGGADPQLADQRGHRGAVGLGFRILQHRLSDHSHRNRSSGSGRP